MPLTNQHTSMVDRFGEAQFENLSLQSPFQEIFDFESEYIIQLHAGFVKHTNSDETTNQGISFEKTTRVSFCKINNLQDTGEDWGMLPSRVRSSRAARRILERVSRTRLASVRTQHSFEFTRFLVCCEDRIHLRVSIQHPNELPQRVWIHLVSVIIH
jgi:hypothetical protein